MAGVPQYGGYQQHSRLLEQQMHWWADQWLLLPRKSMPCLEHLVYSKLRVFRLPCKPAQLLHADPRLGPKLTKSPFHHVPLFLPCSLVCGCLSTPCPLSFGWLSLSRSVCRTGLMLVCCWPFSSSMLPSVGEWKVPAWRLEGPCLAHQPAPVALQLICTA